MNKTRLSFLLKRCVSKYEKALLTVYLDCLCKELVTTEQVAQQSESWLLFFWTTQFIQVGWSDISVLNSINVVYLIRFQWFYLIHLRVNFVVTFDGFCLAHC